MENINAMIEYGWKEPFFGGYLSDMVYKMTEKCTLNYSTYNFLSHDSCVPLKLDAGYFPNMGIQYFGGEITDSDLVFYNSYKEKHMAYSKNRLQYLYVPNIVGTDTYIYGVAYVSVFTQNRNQQLFSSGQLSGCTVCVCYLPEESKIHFFHVGGNRVTYAQKNKFYDLFRALYYTIYNESTSISADSVDTAEKLSEKLNEIGKERQIVVGIYFRNEEREVTIKQKISSNRSNIYIKSYYGYGEMLASKDKNNLFSIYYFRGDSTSPNMILSKRKNYFK